MSTELDWRPEPSAEEREAGKRWLARREGGGAFCIAFCVWPSPKIAGVWYLSDGGERLVYPGRYEFAHVDENLQATPWPVPEPAWGAECRAALEPVLGAGEWRSDTGWLLFGRWSATIASDGSGLLVVVGPSDKPMYVKRWPHAAQFIRAAQDRTAEEVADWMDRSGWASCARQLRSGAWREMEVRG